jgi:hypothetical protein
LPRNARVYKHTWNSLKREATCQKYYLAQKIQKVPITLRYSKNKMLIGKRKGCGSRDISILKLSIGGRSVVCFMQCSFHLGERARGTNKTGSSLGARVVLKAVEKRKVSYPSRKSNPEFLIVQPLAQSLYPPSYLRFIN